MTTQNVMFYCSLIAAVFIVAAGVLKDAGFEATAVACAVVSLVNFCAVFLAWLDNDKSTNYDTRTGRGG